MTLIQINPELKLAPARQAALQRLNAAIAAERRAMITDLPGQEMIYLAKEAEAYSWLANPTEDLSGYPLMAAEIGVTAPDAESLAQLWANLVHLWRMAAAQLEQKRLRIKTAIEQATTLAGIDQPLQELAS